MRIKKSSVKRGMGPGQKKKDCFGSRATSTQKSAWAREDRRKAAQEIRAQIQDWRTA